MMTKDFPILERHLMGCAAQFLSIGEIHDQVTKFLNKFKLLALLDEEKANEIQKKVSLKDQYRPFHPEYFDASRSDLSALSDSQFEELKSLILNPQMWPLLSDDKDIARLLKFVKKGVIMMVAEHDILRDDGLIFMERAEAINKTLKSPVELETVMFKGCFHGILNYSKYGQYINMDKVMGKDGNAKITALWDAWFEKVKNFME